MIDFTVDLKIRNMISSIVMGKTLLVHFVGEMGHELMSFQGYVRAMSRNYDKTIVITRPLNGAIYADFADEIIAYTPSTENTNHSTCVDDMPPRYYDQFDYDDIIPANTTLAKWFPGKGIWVNKKIVPSGLRQEFVRYGRRDRECGYDILFHVRSTNKKNTGRRNQPASHWMELVQNLQEFSIACIGTEKASLWIPGTDDMRGVGMQRLMNLMASSELVAGVSSGPIHLASLCGTPHLVWSQKLNRRRYFEDWNPFRTECVFMDQENWKPSAEKVEKAIREYFTKK